MWHGRVAQICARGSVENNFLGANLRRQSGAECQGLSIEAFLALIFAVRHRFFSQLSHRFWSDDLSSTLSEDMRHVSQILKTILVGRRQLEA